MRKPAVIKANYLFNRVYRKGKRCQGRYISFYFVRRQVGRRFGVAVSRRLRGAVARNRMKRYLRELSRLHQSSFVPGVDVILMGRDFPETDVYQTLEADFLKVLAKSGLLNEA